MDEMITDITTNQPVEFRIRPVTQLEIKNNRYNRSGGWAFNWMTDAKDGFTIYALTTTSTPPNTVEGLVSVKARHEEGHKYVQLEHVETSRAHKWKPNNGNPKRVYEGIGITLVAFACLMSMREGFEGAVQFVSKSPTAKFYVEKLKATQIGGSSSFYFTEAVGQYNAQNFLNGGSIVWAK